MIGHLRARSEHNSKTIGVPKDVNFTLRRSQPEQQILGHSGRNQGIITAASNDRFLITKRSLPTSVPDWPFPPLLRHAQAMKPRIELQSPTESIEH